jgi:hypothetical protein
MTVWAVEQGNTPPGITIAIYDNEAAAEHHVANYDGMVLDHGADLLRVVPWKVQNESRVGG